MTRPLLVLALLAGLLTGPASASAASEPTLASFQGHIAAHDPDAGPITDACVTATVDGWTPLAHACTDSGGNFVLQAPYGVYFAVLATAPGRSAVWARNGLTFWSATRYAALRENDGFTPAIEIVAGEPAATLRARITDQDGRALQGVFVKVITDHHDGYARTDVDGRFRLDNVPAGLVTIFNGIGPQTLVVGPGEFANADRQLDGNARVVDFIAIDKATGQAAGQLCLWVNSCGPGGTGSFILPAGQFSWQVTDTTVDGFGHFKGLVGTYPNYYFQPPDVNVEASPGTRLTQEVFVEPATFLHLTAVDVAGNSQQACFYPRPTHLPLGTVDLRFRNDGRWCPEWAPDGYTLGPLPLGTTQVFMIARSGEMGWLSWPPGATGLTGDQSQGRVWELRGGFIAPAAVVVDTSMRNQVRGVAWDPALQQQVAVCAHPFAESPYLKWTDDWLNTSLAPNQCSRLATLNAGATPIPVLITGAGYAPVWVDDATSRVHAHLLRPGYSTGAGTWDVVLRPAGRLEVAGGATEVSLFDAYSGDGLSPSALNTGRVFVRYHRDGKECWYAPVSLRRFIPGGMAQRVWAGSLTTITVSSITCRLGPPTLLSPATPLVIPRRTGP